MHEGAIVQSIFDSAEEIKKKENLKNVTTIKIIVGEYHQIVKEVMFTYFDIMKLEYNGFKKAKLEMDVIPAEIQCKSCGKSFNINDPIMICPNCQSFETELIKGKELYIKAITGETKDS
ncbi:MAG: hydrogenase maturation nickel metallochaperone HypA [Candidatus Marinimicrobia bacterium]|jgi:hydrogenase nickel incorporation protein HypA/HybF|nr:hydrogenase maturation nickel metallochaperone HypA [Candidatus Neomarinimicrobiota bacterium]